MIVNDNHLVRYFRVNDISGNYLVRYFCGTGDTNDTSNTANLCDASKASASVTRFSSYSNNFTSLNDKVQCKRGSRRGRTRNTKSEVSDPHEAHHHHHHHHHQALFTTDLQLCTLECAKVPAKNLASLLGHLDLRSVPQTRTTNTDYWGPYHRQSKNVIRRVQKAPDVHYVWVKIAPIIWKYGCPVNSRQPNEEVNSPRETSTIAIYLNNSTSESTKKLVHITGM